jgi:hypothetical protein
MLHPGEHPHTAGFLADFRNFGSSGYTRSVRKSDWSAHSCAQHMYHMMYL